MSKINQPIWTKLSGFLQTVNAASWMSGTTRYITNPRWRPRHIGFLANVNNFGWDNDMSMEVGELIDFVVLSHVCDD